MSTKREPLLSDERILDPELTIPLGAKMVRDIYEAARAKDAELIQRLVDGLAHAQDMAKQHGFGPMETVNWDLDAAAAAGFTATQP